MHDEGGQHGRPRRLAVVPDGPGAAAPAAGGGAARRPRSLPARGPDGRFLAGRGLALDDPSLYLNRELSWLEFNRRVLAQATDSSVPLLERLRFVAIFASNLDEFFQVRVAGLREQVAAGLVRPAPDGRSPAEQLAAVTERLRPMLALAAQVLHEQLLPLLERAGVALRSMQDLTEAERTTLGEYFERTVFPVLTPLAVDPGHPFPYISSLSLSLAVVVYDPRQDARHFARVKVPEVLPRFVDVGDGATFVPLEDLMAANLGGLFPGMQVVGSTPFRVTRDADLDLAEDEAEDLLLAIEEELRNRRFGAPVRLEVGDTMPDAFVALLQRELEVDDDATFRLPGLLGLDALAELADLDLPDLRWDRWTQEPHPQLRVPDADLFTAIRERDVLVHHPYDSFVDTTQRFILAASEDPDVLAIKQTLYRTSGDSPIVRALIRAAERGKQVVVLVELKARFDELANIEWARRLEQAGVHVVYGLLGLKTHSKTALVVRREGDAIRRYVHIGTGNYNPRTAALYTDLGMLSADEQLGADLTDLFNYLTGYARQDTYRELLVAPVSLRKRIAALIQREVRRQQEGGIGLIRCKLNSLLDADLVAELYRASRAGVHIELVVRGICALQPGLPGVSDRIRVVSIVGRLLEHARIMQFGEDYFIGSADWMPRNLDRRVEVFTPVCDETLREELRTVLDVELADNLQAWTLGLQGRWTRRRVGDGEEPLSAQSWFAERASARAQGRRLPLPPAVRAARLSRVAAAG